MGQEEDCGSWLATLSLMIGWWMMKRALDWMMAEWFALIRMCSNWRNKMALLYYLA